MAKHIREINFFTLLGALVLFFLPWTNIQCNNRDVATQSGAQAVYGGVSLSEELQQMADKTEKQDSPQADAAPRPAYLIALAVALVITGTILSALALFKGVGNPRAAGVLAAVALALILTQTALGFPVNRSIAESRRDASKNNEQDLGPAMTAAMVFRAQRTNWFYLELLLLAIPAACYVQGRLPKPQAAQ